MTDKHKSGATAVSAEAQITEKLKQICSKYDCDIEKLKVTSLDYYLSRRDSLRSKIHVLHIIYSDHSPVTIFLKDFEMTNNLLSSIHDFIETLTTVTTLILQNCHLDEFQIDILESIVSLNTIEDINIDNNPNAHTNVFKLFRNNTSLKYVSLKHCKINDDDLQMICNQMNTFLNCSITTVNLTSNFVSDKGARCIGDMLRVNRILTSLNLADNFISDDGCLEITNAIKRFELTHEEIVFRRQENMKILKNEMLNKQVVSAKSKSRSNLSVYSSKKEISRGSIRRSISSLNETLKNEYNHPFLKDSVPENGSIWCNGNLSLRYLNLAFNKITTKGVIYVQEAIEYQKLNKTSNLQGIQTLKIHGSLLSCERQEIINITDLINAKSCSVSYISIKKEKTSKSLLVMGTN